MKKRFTVAKARNELEAWKNLNEQDSKAQEMLVEYWQDGAGWEWITNKNISDFAAKYAWSAAFVAFIMRLQYPVFPKSATHANYTVTARERAKEGKKTFIAFEPKNYKPKAGDIAVKRRGYTGTLEGLKTTDKTHGDIVSEVNNGYITVIGGNVSNTVKESIIPTENGYITNKKWFAIIKM